MDYPYFCYRTPMPPEIFVKKVVTAYQNSQGIFTNKVNAEELTPVNADEWQKACYLFYVIQIDYAIKSQRLYQGALRLFNSDPSFFDPKYQITLKENKLRKYFLDYLKPRYINEAVKRYCVNSSTLVALYHSDPRIIFKLGSTAEEVLSLIRKFRGFGPKIGNFFVRTMINSFNYEYADIDRMLPPVDIHDVRIAYLLGFLDSSDMSQRNICATKELWSEACKQAGVSWLIFDKALWLLGSEGKPKSGEDVKKLINSTY